LIYNKLFFLKTDSLIFTDSGPFGETSIENPMVKHKPLDCQLLFLYYFLFAQQGSVYMIDLEDKFIRPLALNCLAYPSGLALSTDEKILYVCETCKNRVLRFVLTPQGIFYFR